MGASTSNPSVLAIVLTHNAPHTLARCLQAIAAQTKPPDAVLVVDNASTPPAELSPGMTNASLLRNTENNGPAGGHATGLRAFTKSDHDAAWVMDDDCVPHADCLALLVEHASDRDAPSLVFPTWFDTFHETVMNAPAWCGFLVDRRIVETVGLPREDFVWWAEDTEYLQWRIWKAGFEITRADDAVVDHTRTREPTGRPAWKVYYETRNTVFFRLYVQRKPFRRFRRGAKSLTRLLGQIVLRDDHKAAKLVMYCRGIFDGLFGRLGRRVPLGAREHDGASTPG